MGKIPEEIPRIEEVWRRIKLALKEGVLTPASLKIYPDIRDVAEEAVRYLETVGMVSVDPASGEISLNEKTPYGSFEEALRYHMPLWNTSLEASFVEDPERYEKLKEKLRPISVAELLRRKLVTLYVLVLEGEAEVAGKIAEIGNAINSEREMSICEVKLYREDLADELMLFALLFRQEPIEEAPYGFVSEADAIAFYGQMGFEPADVKSVLKVHCDMKLLREDMKSEEKRYALFDMPKIILGDPQSEKKNTILERKIRSVLDRK